MFEIEIVIHLPHYVDLQQIPQAVGNYTSMKHFYIVLL